MLHVTAVVPDADAVVPTAHSSALARSRDLSAFEPDLGAFSTISRPQAAYADGHLGAAERGRRSPFRDHLACEASTCPALACGPYEARTASQRVVRLKSRNLRCVSAAGSRRRSAGGPIIPLSEVNGLKGSRRRRRGHYSTSIHTLVFRHKSIRPSRRARRR